MDKAFRGRRGERARSTDEKTGGGQQKEKEAVDSEESVHKHQHRPRREGTISGTWEPRRLGPGSVLVCSAGPGRPGEMSTQTFSSQGSQVQSSGTCCQAQRHSTSARSLGHQSTSTSLPLGREPHHIRRRVDDFQ